MENYNNSPYDNGPQVTTPPAPRKERNNLAIASMIVGIFALISCCCSILGVVLSIIGIVLVILSKKGKPLDGFAVAGLVLSILGLIGSLAFFAYYIVILQIYQDPESAKMMNDMMDVMNQYMGTSPVN